MTVSRRALLAAVAVLVIGCLVARGGLLGHERGGGDIVVYQGYADKVAAGHMPYRSGFSLEYPPGAIPVFLFPRAFGDGHYALAFKLLMTLFAAAALVVVADILGRLGATPKQSAWSLGALALAPVLDGPTYLNRYDWWPALLVVVGLDLLLRGRARSGLAFLGAGFAAKLYAGVVVIPAALWLWRRSGRAAAWRGVAVAAVAAAVVSLPFLLAAPGGVAFSVERQFDRHLQVESLGASILLALQNLGLKHTGYAVHALNSVDLTGGLAESLRFLTTVVQLVAIAAVAVLCWRRGVDSERLVAAAAAAVAGFVAFGKVLSPQYVIWLLPLVPLVLGRRGRLALIALLAALPLSQLELDHGDQLKVGGWPVWVVLTRDLLLVGVFALLVATVAERRDLLRT